MSGRRGTRASNWALWTTCLIAGIAGLADPCRAQGGDWPSILAAAKAEGKVTVYTATQPDETQRIADGFRKAYPELSIVTFRGQTGDLLPRLEQERLSGSEGGDVLLSTDVGFLLAQQKEHRLLEPKGPSFAKWPAQYLRGGLVPSVGFDPIVMVYNTKIVKDPPKGYADVLRTEFKSKVGIIDLASTTVVAWYDWVERTQVPDYLVKLKAQIPKTYPGNPALPQAVASGEVAVANFGTVASAEPMIKMGAPLAIVVPDHTMGFQFAVGGFRWSRHPNAAQVFIDYILSREGQSAWHSDRGSASPLPNIPGALTADSILPYDPSSYPPSVVAQYTAHWNQIMK